VRYWSFHVRVRWCYDGRSVTSADEPEVWGTVTASGRTLGWSYKPDGEVVAPREDIAFMGPVGPEGYPEHWGYKIHVRGTFDNCPPRLVCVQEKHPEITFRIFGDGTHRAEGNIS
jgi:hypothetical protein